MIKTHLISSSLISVITNCSGKCCIGQNFIIIFWKSHCKSSFCDIAYFVRFWRNWPSKLSIPVFFQSTSTNVVRTFLILCIFPFLKLCVCTGPFLTNALMSSPLHIFNLSISDLFFPLKSEKLIK